MKKEFVTLSFNKRVFGHTLEMAKLYMAFSNIEKTPELANMFKFDQDALALINLIEVGAEKHYDWNLITTRKTKTKMSRTSSVVVCFSGGKDSTAAALLYKQKGYDVHLFYLRGINKSYPEEENNARNIAKHLGFPLYIGDIKQHGTSTFPDNPIKNQLIASMALDYAVANNIGTDIVFGDYYTHSISNSSFGEAWSDCIELWEAHESYVRSFVPNYVIHIPFHDSNEPLNLVSKDRTLLSLIQSCVLPYRFRQMTKTRNEKKYNTLLLPNRCGSCWKCCMEYIYHADNNIVPYNDDFYKHCLTFLLSKMKELKPAVIIEKGHEFAIVYNAFLDNDFKLSKYYNKHYDDGINKD